MPDMPKDSIMENVNTEDFDIVDESVDVDAQDTTKTVSDAVKNAKFEGVKVEGAEWYVVHTYSGYENKVKGSIEKIIENRNMQDFFEQIMVPVQETLEIKNGKKKSVQRKIYPGYVLLKMILTEDTWYIVRNTRGVTSFVGPASKPVPLTEDEIIAMGIEVPDYKLDLELDEMVRIITGPFEGSVGNVKDINQQKKTVSILLSVFGRETQVELDYHMVQRMM